MDGISVDECNRGCYDMKFANASKQRLSSGFGG